MKLINNKRKQITKYARQYRSFQSRCINVSTSNFTNLNLYYFLRNGLKIDLSEPLNTSETDEEVGKDRELINDFMGYTSETQRLLTICDTANQ